MTNLFDRKDTLCDRQNNRCKQRGKCLRHERQDRNGWVANYFEEFGKYCEHFQPMPEAAKKEEEKKAVESTAKIPKISNN